MRMFMVTIKMLSGLGDLTFHSQDPRPQPTHQARSLARALPCKLGDPWLYLARPPESRESPIVTFNLVIHWPAIVSWMIIDQHLIPWENPTHSDVLSTPLKARVKTLLRTFHLCSHSQQLKVHMNSKGDLQQMCWVLLWKEHSQNPQPCSPGRN